MYQIKRPDSPEWEGAWMPWLAHSSSEAQAVLSLTCEAFAKWHAYSKKRNYNVESKVFNRARSDTSKSAYPGTT